MNFVLAPLAVVALTELFNRVKSKDYEGVLVIVVASIIGGAAGFLGLAGLTLTTGVMAGLSAVGVHTAASAAGGK